MKKSLHSIDRLARRNTGFTRVEFLAVLFALAGLGLLALPALGAGASRSRLAQCFNNLRQVGAGFQSWAMSNGDKFPWQVRKADGGLNNINNESPVSQNPYIHFAIISNELVTPRVLICPSDLAVRVASDFSSSPTDGFLALNFRNNAVGYFIGMDATPERPGTMLIGDRNVRTSRAAVCGAVFVPAKALTGLDPSVDFTNGLHRFYGQVGLADGSVQTGNGSLLRKLALNSGDSYDPSAIGGPSPNNHILVPGNPPVIAE